MTKPAGDEQSLERRARDEQIAVERRLAPLDLPPDVAATPLEGHLARRGRPLAVAGRRGKWFGSTSR